MRLLAITPFLWTVREDGGMPSAYRSLTGLRDNGFDVHVLMPSEGPRATMDYRGLTLHTFPVPRFGLRGTYGPTRSALLMDAPEGRLTSLRWKAFLSALLALSVRHGLSVARNTRPDVLYGILPTGALAASAIGRLRGVPNVTRLFGTHLAPVPTRDLPRHLWEVAAFKAPARMLIVTDDGTMGDVVAQRLRVPSDRVRLLLNGVEEEFFGGATPEHASTIKRDMGLSPTTHLFLSAHHLFPSHHCDAFVQAVASLVDADHDVIGVLAGDGPERPRLEDLAQRRSPGRVIFLGDVTRVRVREVMGAATAVVSLDELSNVVNSVLESLAMGVPVVATRTGTTDRVLADGRDSLLIEADALDRLSDPMARLVREPALHARLASGARATAATTLCTWEERMAREAELVTRFVVPR